MHASEDMLHTLLTLAYMLIYVHVSTYLTLDLLNLSCKSITYSYVAKVFEWRMLQNESTYGYVAVSKPSIIVTSSVKILHVSVTYRSLNK